jgi:hypothetical protein
MKKSKLFLFFLFLVIITCLVILRLLVTNEKKIQPEIETSGYYQNHRWMFNINVFQYSSYIIIDSTTTVHRIELMAYLNDINMKKDQLNCLAHSISTSQTYKLEIIEFYHVVVEHCYKIICKFDHNTIPSELNDITVAVVVRNDFESQFPLDMINFQIPTIIHAQNPRQPQVGVCVNYIPDVYAGISNWVQMHKDFNVAEMVMHDASQSGALKNLLYPKFEANFIEIRDYYLGHDYVCNTEQVQSRLQLHPTLAKTYLQICTNFMSSRLRNHDGSHNHLSCNDCYTSLYYKYEFVILYDLDELVIPRKNNIMDIAKKQISFECNDRNNICEYKAVLNYYDYLKDIIKNNFKENISKLRSIAFHHSAYLLPTEIQTALMKNLKDIVDKIKLKQDKFPFLLSLQNFQGFRHTFTISESDKDYAVYLSDKFDAMSCLFDKNIKNSPILEQQWKRFVYFHTNYEQRFPKSIHYTKNVQTLFTHDASAFTKDSIILNADKENGHMNSHFRGDLVSFYHEHRTSSIRNIGIDFDYLMYLIKDFTTLC